VTKEQKGKTSKQVKVRKYFRLSKMHPPWWWALFVAVSIACTVFAVQLFPSSFPIVNLSVPMQRTQAMASALEVTHHHNPPRSERRRRWWRRRRRRRRRRELLILSSSPFLSLNAQLSKGHAWLPHSGEEFHQAATFGPSEDVQNFIELEEVLGPSLPPLPPFSSPPHAATGSPRLGEAAAGHLRRGSARPQ